MQEMREKIRLYRKMRGLTQVQIAKMLGMPTSGYSNLETGISALTLERFLDISKILKFSIADILKLPEDTELKERLRILEHERGMAERQRDECLRERETLYKYNQLLENKLTQK